VHDVQDGDGLGHLDHVIKEVIAVSGDVVIDAVESGIIGHGGMS
jgi:hypothetical protein